MNDLERWEPDYDPDLGAYMRESVKGEWMAYDDHQKEVERLRARLPDPDDLRWALKNVRLTSIGDTPEFDRMARLRDALKEATP